MKEMEIKGVFSKIKYLKHIKYINDMINYKYTIKADINQLRKFYNRYEINEEMISKYFLNAFEEDIIIKLTLLFDNVNPDLFERYNGYKRADVFLPFLFNNINAKKYLDDGFICCNQESLNKLLEEANKITTKRRRRIYKMFLKRTFVLDFVEDKVILFHDREKLQIITNDTIRIKKDGDYFVGTMNYKFKIFGMTENKNFGMDNYDYANVNNTFRRTSRFSKIKFRIFSKLDK